jgi:poly(A) polymerase
MTDVSSRNLAIACVRRLKEGGYPAYLAGGCVRDRLLGSEPHDYDVATSATPAQVKALFPDAFAVGAHFGVVLLKRDGAEVQIATFRTDHAYLDGRRPESVTFETDPKQDVLRRDFTINGLLEDPETGAVLDYVGGRADLDARIIRAIGDPGTRFSEDALRLLRAVRFAARLRFAIDETTAQAIRRDAPLIHQISAERVREELARILTEGQARRGFELLFETGLLREVLPEVERMSGVPQPPQFHPEGDVWTHTLLLLEQLPAGCPEPLAWACLLHDVAKPVTMTVTDRIRFNGHAEQGAAIAKEILVRLRSSNDMTDAVVEMIKNHMRFIEAPRMGPAAFKRFARLAHFDSLLELHRLDLLASWRGLEGYEAVKRRRDEIPAEAMRPKPLLTGADLIARGLVPGPRFSEILNALEEEQLEGRITTRDAAEAWLTRALGSAST